MRPSRFVQVRAIILMVALGTALALVPAVVHFKPVAAQTSTTPTTTPIGTTTTTTGTTTTTPVPPTGPALSLIGPVTVCGPVTYTAATATATGTIVIGNLTFQINAGVTPVGASLLTNGAMVCVTLALNSSGMVTAVTVSTFTGTAITFSVCGSVSAFSAATATAPGTITIGGVTLPIAAGTTFTGPTVATGTNFCLVATLSAAGAITAGTVSVPLAATPVYSGSYPRGISRATARPD